MSLPMLNSAKYEMTIPSSGKTIEYRPFVVKEEKVLLTVLESNDMKQITSAIRNLVEVCTFNEVKVEDLAMFDLEYIFLKLRAKSVGENANIMMPCKKCDHKNEMAINLDQVELSGDPKAAEKIQLSDNVGVRMKFPTVKLVERMMKSAEGTSIDVILSLVASSIESIYDSENVYSAKDHKPEEVLEFVESLNKEQFAKIQAFFEKFPKLRKETSFTCVSCGEKNDVVLEGLNDFFV